jgi:rSAM/selenodomain-associated transferase 1
MSLKRVAAAVFVKTPGYSPLKTRLAAGLSKAAAEEFHRRATQCLQETLTLTAQQSDSTDLSLTPYWAVAEESAREHPLWAGFQTTSQGSGGLGARMHCVYRQLLEQHDAVLLLGADSPQVAPQTLSQAIESLASHEFVMGPANDGGFYLLAGRQPIPLSLWERVPYSDPQTASRMSEELSALGRIAQTESLVDVDDLNDLQRVIPALKRFPTGSSQQALAVWIEDQFATEH